MGRDFLNNKVLTFNNLDIEREVEPHQWSQEHQKNQNGYSQLEK